MVEKEGKNGDSYLESETEDKISEIKLMLKEISKENKVVLDRTRVKDIQGIIGKLEDQRDKFRYLSRRLANVSADSAELYAELDEKNVRLSEVTARSAELVAELELKKEALESLNNELAKANAHACELMAEIEIKNEEIEKLNGALANANAHAAEILAELEESREELKRTRAIVKKEGSRLKTYVDVASVIFVVIGSDQRVKLINPKGCEVLGYREKELLGSNWFDMVIPEENRNDVMTHFNRIISGELSRSHYVESEIISRSGEVKTIAWHNSYMKDDQGNITSTVSSGEDITEKLKLRREIEEREMQFRLLTENQGDIVFSINYQGNIIYCSPTVKEFGGYQQNEVVGSNVLEYLDNPDDYEKIIPLIENLIHNRASDSAEFMYKSKSGNSFPVEVFGHPTFKDDRFESIQCVMRDIRKRKWNEENLLFQKDIARMLMSSESKKEGISEVLGIIQDYTRSQGILMFETMDDNSQGIIGNDSEKNIWTNVIKNEMKRTIKEFISAGETFSGTYELGDGTVSKMPIKEKNLFSIPMKPGSGDKGFILIFMNDTRSLRKDQVETIERTGLLIGEFLQRMQIEEMERKSRERLDMALEAGNLGLWELDIQKQNLHMDDSWLSFLGYNRDEVGKGFDSWKDLIHPQDRGTALSHLRVNPEAIPEKIENEFRVKAKNGTWRWLHIKGRVSERDENGRAVRLSGTQQDITESKYSEEELRKSEERLSTFMDSATDGFMLLDKDMRLIMANESGSERFEVPLEEAIGRKLTELVPLEERSERHDALMEVFRTGKPYFTEELVSNWNPGMNQFSMKAFRSGEDLGIIISDITKIKLAEYGTAVQKAYMEELFEGSPEAIVVLDRDDRVLRINRGFTELFGFKPEEASGCKINDLIVPEELKEEGMALTNQVSNGKTLFNETRRLTKDGQLIDVSILGTPISIEGRLEAVYGIYRDISKQKNAEKEMLKARREAEEATRMKSEFLANMSHEIRTPMNAILGFSEILSGKIEDPSLKEYLDAIRSGGKTLLRLINDILDLSKIESGKLELCYQPISISSLTEEMKKIFRNKADSKGLFLKNEILGEIPEDLHLDEVRIRQVIMNLVGNALKFTEKGGISIKSWVNPNEDGNYDLHLMVSDTGIGIPEEERERIFGMFDQMKGQDSGKYGGTGLGLAISRRLISMMKGSIELKSEVGKGSQFHIIIEDVKRSPDAREKIEREDFQGKIVFKGSRILVADDVESNRGIVRGFLESHDLQITEVENGKEALDVLSKDGADLILLDIKMPVMDGFETAEAIRKDLKMEEIPIIALTASIIRKGEEELVFKGFNGALLKPFSKEDLLSNLANFLPHESVKDTIEKETKTCSESGEIDISCFYRPDSSEIPDKIIRELEEPLKKATDTSSMDSMEEVSNKLQALGRDLDIQELSRLGSDLNENVIRFDIEGMTNNLRKASNLVSKLKNNLNTGELVK